MEPFSWLLLKLTCLRLGRLRLGIGPVRELFWRFKEVRNGQILYGIWNAASEGIEGEVKNIELWGER